MTVPPRFMRGWRRFRTMTLPLLMPTTLFLLVVNLVYSAFDTFGTIDAITHGGPGQATETLVVKVYRDGIVNLDVGSSSAQSVVLMLGVIVVTAIQFRFMVRRGAPARGGRAPDFAQTRAKAALPADTEPAHASAPRPGPFHQPCTRTNALQRACKARARRCAAWRRRG